jgi:endonuclease G
MGSLSGALVLLASAVSFMSLGQDQLFAPAVQGELLENGSYLVDFDGASRIPHWVAYELTAEEGHGAVGRSDNFSVDERVATSAPSKWPGSGFDRGHMKPAADSRGSAAEMQSSFLMTNMAPQTPALNRGEWKGAEELVRAWSAQYGRVYVVMGPGQASRGTIAGGVRVPTHFWKAVLRYGADTSAVAFVFPNSDEVPGEVGSYRVTVDSLESFSGLNVFAALPDHVESRVESEWGRWDLQRKRPSSAAKSEASSESSVRCTGWSKSKGSRCSNRTKHLSGRCHHHRD